MTDEQVRAAALAAAIEYYGYCRSGEVDLPRQQVVETAVRFEEYIRTGS